MKKLTLLLMALVLAIGAQAQSSILVNPDNRPYWGARIGFDLACPSDVEDGPVGDDKYANGPGFHIGGIYNMPIVANFYIEPGLSLYYNTYRLRNQFIGDKEMQWDGRHLKSVWNRTLGFRIPVMAGYHFDFTDQIKVHVYTGPELDVALRGREHLNGIDWDANINLYGDDGKFNRVNVLWKFGVGVAYEKYWAQVGGGLGMCNMSSIKGTTMHQNLFSITLGYNF